MPPRSATRKKSTRTSARAKKSTPKSEQLDVESTPIEQSNAELENEGRELVASDETDRQGEGVSGAVTVVEQIKQEIGVLDTNSAAVEDLPSARKEKFVVRSHLEASVKEESNTELEGVKEVSTNLDVESTPIEQTNTELENEGRELVASDDTDRQEEGVSAAVTVVEEIKQEIGVLDTNSAAVEDLQSAREENFVVSTNLEASVKEEVVEEESIVGVVMGDHTNVNIDSFIEGGDVADEDGVRVESVQSESGNEKNDEAEDVADEDGVRLEGVPSKGGNEEDDEAEEKGVEGTQNEGSNVGDGGTQLALVPVAERMSCDEGTAASQIGDVETLGDNDKALAINEGSDEKGKHEGDGKDEEDDGDSEEDNKVDNEDEEHPSVFINNHIADRNKEKDLEIFIGSLDRGASEDDLIQVFGLFGEIRSVRVVRSPTTNKSRGFAFIQYATVEQAKNALSELKGGIQVRGKHVKISASQDKDTLYMGNICKLWTKERVLETLKSYGVENIEDVHLPDDPQKEGKIKGFALLEFSTHADALTAFQRLRKPDAVFGRDRSAKVAFAQTPMHPNQEVLCQVKTVYVEGLSDDWNQEKVKEICKQYGEVVNVTLSRSLGTKRKDYGFISFTSQESALVCVEGINNAHIGGEVKLKANIAKPRFKGRLQKQGTRGGFKVKEMSPVPSTKEGTERENEVVSSKINAHPMSKRAKKKAKVVAKEKGKTPSDLEICGGKPNKQATAAEDGHIQESSKSERTNRKRKNLQAKADSHGTRRDEHGHNEKPSKKHKGDKRGRQSDNLRKPKRDPRFRNGSNNGANFIRYSNPHALGYAASAASHQRNAYATTSGSKRPHADMAPHAGYIEPVARKQSRRTTVYVEPPVGMQYQPHARYHESAVGPQSQPHTGYREPAVGQHGRPHAGYLQHAVGTHGQPHAAFRKTAVGTHGQPHAGYLEPAVGRQGQSHAGYSEPPVARYSHAPYDLGFRSAGGQDFHVSGHSVYGAGSSRPHSYVPNYTNHSGYENGSNVGGHYQSSGAHLPRRAYY